MKVAIVGSRSIRIDDLAPYIPKETTEIVSGGASGVDTCAKDYAISHKIKLTEFLPNYERYGKAAPIKRNSQIVNYADEVIAFWDGKSHGTKHVLDLCKKLGKEITVYRVND